MTDGRTPDARWTDRRVSRNSDVDRQSLMFFLFQNIKKIWLKWKTTFSSSDLPGSDHLMNFLSFFSTSFDFCIFYDICPPASKIQIRMSIFHQSQVTIVLFMLLNYFRFVLILISVTRCFQSESQLLQKST